MGVLPSILSLFRNEFNKFNNTIYHMTLKLRKYSHFGMKMSRFCLLLCNLKMDVITLHCQSVNHWWLSILLHGVISLPAVMSFDKCL